jgi:hypothetical protein
VIDAKARTGFGGWKVMRCARDGAGADVRDAAKR